MAPRNPLEIPHWPAPPSGVDDAALELYKAQLAEITDRRTEFPTAEHESQVAVEGAQIEVIKGTLDRARDSAKVVQTAASAIAALYTGVASLIFKIDADKPLPTRGIIVVIYLGAAIVFSTAFLAWVDKGAAVEPFPESNDPGILRSERVKWFNNWAALTVLRRAWCLRVATLCLGVGLVFLPAAFIAVGKSQPSVDSGASALVSTTVPWPTPSKQSPRTDAILYQAQVNEAATQRANGAESDIPSATSGFVIRELFIWLAAILAALVIAGYIIYQVTTGSLRDAVAAIEYSSPPQTSPAVPSQPLGIHVVPAGGVWVVEREGVDEPVSTHPTQAAAEKAGRELAWSEGAEFILHNRHGQIREHDSYRHDSRDVSG